MNNRKLLVLLMLGLLVVAAGLGVRLSPDAAPEEVLAQGSRVPVFQEEAGWLKVPAKWKLGNVASVAVDLRISQVVDVPNFIVSAFLPLEIFDAGE